jgi:hypothetical protein
MYTIVPSIAEKPTHLFEGESSALDAMLEGLPFQKLPGDEGHAVLLVNLVDGADVGMI